MQGQVYHEQCNCPEHDTNKWLSDMKCPDSFGQIERDLANFPVIDISRLRNEGFSRLDKTALCHYSLLKGKVCTFSPSEVLFLSWTEIFLSILPDHIACKESQLSFN